MVTKFKVAKGINGTLQQQNVSISERFDSARFDRRPFPGCPVRLTIIIIIINVFQSWLVNAIAMIKSLFRPTKKLQYT